MTRITSYSVQLVPLLKALRGVICSLLLSVYPARLKLWKVWRFDANGQHLFITLGCLQVVYKPRRFKDGHQTFVQNFIRELDEVVVCAAGSRSIIDELVELLPVASDLHFSIIEEKLADEKSSHQMISYLSRIGGVQCEQGVKFMLRKVLTDEVACTFSLMGFRGKKAFQTTNICKAIMGSVRNNPSWKDVQEKEVERFISNWLRHAKGRIQQRKLRLIK